MRRKKCKNYLGWVVAPRRKKEYIVYYIFFPDTSTYAGFTSKHFFQRWRSHIARKSNSALKEALKKFEPNEAKVIILQRFDNINDALQYEIFAIKQFSPTLNRSKGGEAGSTRLK